MDPELDLFDPVQFAVDTTVGSPITMPTNVSISAETYARLVMLADQAPLECLQLNSRTLDRARTLGYNKIGQIRTAPLDRLISELGNDRTEELQRALHDFGMREKGVSECYEV